MSSFRTAFDIVVLGSGFGGSLIAMMLCRRGFSVLLLERGHHPRFAIGESSTPISNLLLERIGLEYDLPRLRPLAQWGTWQATYPHIGCGLKRGFSFFKHASGSPFLGDPSHESQLLVAASSNDAEADTHWYRPDFDHFLVSEAQSQGVDYLDRVELAQVSFVGESVHLEGERCGKPLHLQTAFVIDATGPRGALFTRLGLGETELAFLPQTESAFSHFRNVARLGDMGIFPPAPLPPYPVDDAAVHHIFDDGWIWILRFNNGLVSAGVAQRKHAHSAMAKPEEIWKQVLERLPTVRDQFAGARAEIPFQHISRLGFRCATLTGQNWVLLPSAAGFVDPLLSTGFTLNLLGILRLSEIIDRFWGTGQMAKRLNGYAEATTLDLLVTERLVAALYSCMRNFGQFTMIARLYFAAVSYAELSWRLGRTDRAGSFLLREDPEFGPAFEECLKLAVQVAQTPDSEPAVEALRTLVLRTIAPVDLIGLSDLTRQNWYGVHHDDLLTAASKLGLTANDVRQILTTR